MSTIDNNSYCGFADNWTSSEVKVHEITHVWTINNFDFCEASGSVMNSPIFSASTGDKAKWFIQLTPNGKTDRKDTIDLLLNLCGSSECKTVFAKFTFSILINKRDKVASKSCSAVREFDVTKKQKDAWGWPNFCSKDANFRNNLLSNNVLHICCEVIFSQEKDLVIEHHDFRNSLPLTRTVADFDLSESFDTLLKTQTLSDVVISVRGKDYPAHKAILAARSNVFSAMFSHDTKENQLSRVDIEDFGEEIVAEMLSFIYTGRCAKLEEFAAGLLAAADKYDLGRLKVICGETLCRNLSIENAASVLLLADMHGANELKSEVMKFIDVKPTEVFNTADWKNVLANPRLTDEVFRALVRR